LRLSREMAELNRKIGVPELRKADTGLHPMPITDSGSRTCRG